MTVDKTTYSIGETVNITIEIVNMGNSTIDLEWTHTSLTMFTVYNQQNQTIYNSAIRVLTQEGVDKLLRPGESWIVPHVSPDTYVDWKQTDEEGNQVPPGKYYIVAEVPSRYSSLMIYDPSEPIINYSVIHIKTPALAITIS